MNIDSSALKNNVDTSEQGAEAIASTLGPKNLNAIQNAKTVRKESIYKKNYEKSFGEYFSELQQALDDEIFIKRTSNINYMAKKWSNLQAYIVCVLAF